MASSLLHSTLLPSHAGTTPSRTRDVSNRGFLPKTSLSHGFNLPSVIPVPGRRIRKRTPRCEASSLRRNLDYIPKQFRAENLKDGLMENFKTVPSNLYGLPESEIHALMSGNGPVSRLREKVTEESISSARHYLEYGGSLTAEPRAKHESIYDSSEDMYSGGRVYGYGRPRYGYRGRRSPPPDLPSILLDDRIVYLGMPIVPEVTELIVAEFMWLDWIDGTKPIYLYVNSPGSLDEMTEEILASEGDSYAIADTMLQCGSPVCTVNLGMAFGMAAMLFSLGRKGYRAFQPNALLQLYPPRMERSVGVTSDVWIKGKELEANTDYFYEFLSQGVGKPKEEMVEFVGLRRVFDARLAIKYGIADKVLHPKTALGL